MPSKLSQTCRFLYDFGMSDDGSVPIRGVHQALGNDLGAIVFAIKRLGINMIVDERGKHGAGNRCRVPAAACRSLPTTLARRAAALWPHPATASRWREPRLLRRRGGRCSLGAKTARHRKPRQKCKCKNGERRIVQQAESFLFSASKITALMRRTLRHSVSKATGRCLRARRIR